MRGPQAPKGGSGPASGSDRICSSIIAPRIDFETCDADQAFSCQLLYSIPSSPHLHPPLSRSLRASSFPCQQKDYTLACFSYAEARRFSSPERPIPRIRAWEGYRVSPPAPRPSLQPPLLQTRRRSCSGLLQWVIQTALLAEDGTGAKQENCASQGITFFQVFASTSGLLGLSRSSDYAAVNGYLNDLITFRRTLGAIGQANVWGQIAGTGLAGHGTGAAGRGGAGEQVEGAGEEVRQRSRVPEGVLPEGPGPRRPRRGAPGDATSSRCSTGPTSPPSRPRATFPSRVCAWP
ncbi:unnamed protein product [Prorocentrum cordatum]|uniref:Ketoreductase (KR) domain-containing protein n=1 Tax=Prorocentrum cordatum TaxID=2364126 RepID=A0ABN9TKP2_9DINO|nr:unnamed protein product [Polarella glacialis]